MVATTESGPQILVLIISLYISCLIFYVYSVGTVCFRQVVGSCLLNFY